MNDLKIPVGWKLVPVEPTEEMLRAGVRAFQHAWGSGEDNLGDWRANYAAMLAAAPTPPAVQEAVSVLSDQITDVRQGRGFSREDWLKLRSMPHGTKLYAHPAPGATQIVPSDLASAALAHADAMKVHAALVPIPNTTPVVFVAYGEAQQIMDLVASSLKGAAQAAQAPVAIAGPEQETCLTCQGNGEIVTDWDRYKNPRQGDAGDEAVAECPDCDGVGKVDAAPVAAQAPQPEPLHITHGPLMRYAATLLRLRKPVTPDFEQAAADLERAVDGQPTPSGEPSPEWLEVAAAAERDLFRDAAKMVTAQAPAVPEGQPKCPGCHGRRLMDDPPWGIVTCPECGGTGEKA